MKLDRQFLLRQLSRLSGLAKFPAPSAIVTQETFESLIDDLLLALDESCVNEDHVTETIREWKYGNDFAPSERQLREQAWSIRARYEPSFRPVEEKAAPMEMTPELRELWQQAVANADRQTEMWGAIKRELKVVDFAQVSWHQVIQTKQKLGYPLNEGDRKMLGG